jgi:hypothetical protein
MATLLDLAAAYSAQVLTTIGLICDAVGAALVAWEVVQQFRGKKFEVARSLTITGEMALDGRGRETSEYLDWEKSKYSKMRWGLFLLMLGLLCKSLGLGLRCGAKHTVSMCRVRL